MITKAKLVKGYSEIVHSEYCYYKAPGRYEGPIDTWYLWIPNVGLGNLAGHEVTENPDGTITVTPSILVEGGTSKVVAHGYLTNGEWRDC